MEFLNNFILPVILGICICLGYIIKKWIKDVDNKYIPTIVAVIGVFLSIWINKWTVTPDVILTGLISGLSSTGLHQAFKQFIENRNM